MNDEKNILSTDEFKEDYENTLRPKSIDEFIGQTATIRDGPNRVDESHI